MSVLNDYYDALERLVNDAPIVVPIGTKISKDTVSLEAGRNRGSIKKSRQSFHGLISDIEEAARRMTPRDKMLSEKLKKKTLELKTLERRYLESLNREVIFYNRVLELEAIVAAANISVIDK